MLTPPQPAPWSHYAWSVAVFILVLLALLIAAIWAMGWYRRNYLLKDEKEEEKPAYNITQLREMYEDGIITGEEFERLRKRIYGRRSYSP